MDVRAIRWDTSDTRLYAVHYAAQPTSSSWTVISNYMPGTGGRMELVDTNRVVTTRVYRVVGGTP